MTKERMKYLYSKYSYLEYSELIRGAIELEYRYSSMKRVEVEKKNYYKNKKYLLDIKQNTMSQLDKLKMEIKVKEEILDSVVWYPTRFERMMRQDMLYRQLADINTRIQKLDIEHNWNSYDFEE